MTNFVKNGTCFRVADERNLDIHRELPAGFYIIKQDMFENFFFELVDGFEVKGKLYGDTIKNTERIFNTFIDREASTGVLLAGEKGSGKSLLAKNISLTAFKAGMPVIIINNAWCGDKFNQLIQQIHQSAVLLFDEFEKVYDQNEQSQILTLMDGVFPTKKLFLITCNDRYRIDQHMRNRPGRIYYFLEFKGLTDEFIREYCEDNLHNKANIDQICKIATLFGEFNFDMLKALTEELNRYGETPQEAMRMLNAKPENDENTSFDLELFVNGAVVTPDNVSDTSWFGTPLQKSVHISYDPTPTDDNSDWVDLEFKPQDIKTLDAAAGKFTFESARGEKLVLTRRRFTQFNYFDAF